MLYVKKDKIPKIWALMASEDQNKNDIRKFEEIGTHSAAMRLAIGEAILFHNAIGGKRKEERLRYLSRYWMNRIKEHSESRFQHIVRPENNRARSRILRSTASTRERSAAI